jgi:hypothetical protein
MTGDTDPQIMRSMAAQGIAVQHKPVDPTRLMAAITHVIQD